MGRIGVSDKRQPLTRWQEWLAPVGCVLGSILVYLVLTGLSASGLQTEPERLARSGYGGDKKQYELLVDGLEAEEVPLTVTVSPQVFTIEEAEEAFYQIMDSMEERIRGDNRSLMEVSSDLKLPAWIDEAGVRLRWYSSDPEHLTSAGKLAAAVRRETKLILHVQLAAEVQEPGAGKPDQKARVHTADFELPVCLIPAVLSAKEQRMQTFQDRLVSEDAKQQNSETLLLPTEHEGRQLRFRKKEESDYTAVPFLGVILGLLLVARKQSEEKDRQKKREEELLLDYAEVVSKLMVFIGAGMTIRNAWERIVRDYQAGLERGRQKSRAAYEEMCQTHYQMENGTPEGTAFREFGRRCRLQPYLKLSSLLEQNRKAGNKNLRSILQTEMADAFEMRKNLARRMGEEAGTKLLLPLFLMLGIVMVMIMVPAMMTMG